MPAEIRHAVTDLEVRAEQAADGKTTITGYAVKWGSRNSYGEIFVPGSFTETLAAFRDKGNPLPLLDQHRQVVGLWVDAVEDDIGLLVTGELSDTQAGRDLATLLTDGAVNGLSVGFWDDEIMLAEAGETVSFSTPTGGQFTSTQDTWTWYIVKARLAEISVVYAPSDDQARILSVRSVGLDQLTIALPGLAGDADWDDVAWSMCRLMGAPGGEMRDLAPAERHAAHRRLAAAYKRHGKAAPDFTPTPEYKTVPFQHGEPSLYRDLSLGKRCSRIVAECGALDRPFSDETRQRAMEARDALSKALDGPEADERADDEPDTGLADLAALLRQAADTISS